MRRTTLANLLCNSNVSVVSLIGSMLQGSQVHIKTKKLPTASKVFIFEAMS